MKNILIWYRNDLRTHDHEPLYTAARNNQAIAAVYCIDPALFGQTKLGFKRVGPFRAQFLLQSLQELRKRLTEIGIILYIRIGKHDEQIAQLAKDLKIDEVYYHREVTDEELLEEAAVEKALHKMKIPLTGFWSATLFHIADLPFPVKHLPDLFTEFRKAIEKESNVRPLFASHKPMQAISADINAGSIPTLEDLEIDIPLHDERAVYHYHGGESSALSRLQQYIHQSQSVAHYKDTRNEMLGANNSSKLSAWLALGCLSPRKVYWEIKEFEARVVKNDSTYWLIFELLWRDYFRFNAMKYGNSIFKRGGIKHYHLPWIEDKELFEKWRLGQTGFPLIDANMQELLCTGIMSNRGRQNVASFLTKNLGINWQWGAAWFESQLIDYDPCSNYGNWNYSAGIGNDARGFRYFNIIKQANDYDAQGKYVKHWIPSIGHLQGKLVHEPYLEPGIAPNYFEPIVDLELSVKQQQRVYENATKRRVGRY
jgi:deoxyribodipyrimidine photo-lyase